MDVFTTPALVTEHVPNDRDDLIIQIDSLKASYESMTANWNFQRDRADTLTRKIDAVRGHIHDLYSMNGEIDDEIKEIAAFLDIELTQRVEGTATIEVSFSFDAPLGFDVDSFDLSVYVESNSYEVDNFDWNEDSVDISCEEA